MKQIIIFIILCITFSCKSKVSSTTNNMTNTTDTTTFKTGYADVNGIKMYYEIYGEGKPVVLIHGGGSTIDITFGRVIPLLAKHHKVIAVEMQAHGRTSDRDRELSFEQDADDITALLKELNIPKADIFGFSNGATTTLQLAIRRPEVIDKMILASPIAKRHGVPDGFWEFMKNSSLDNMPPKLKTEYLKVVKRRKNYSSCTTGIPNAWSILKIFPMKKLRR